MNLGACSSLRTSAENAVWYRAIEPQYATTPLSTTHMLFVATRFSAVALGRPAFQMLYLTENPVAAL